MGQGKYNVKIRPTVLTLFILLCTIIIATTLALQYYFLKDLALNATKDNIKHISEKIEQRINNLDKKNNDIISNLELYKSIGKVPKEKEIHPLLPLITNTLKNNSFLYSIYVGEKNSNFYQIINLNIDKKLKKKYNTTNNMKWLVVKIYNEKNKRVKIEQYLNEDLIILRTIKKEATYNPTIRPWYKSALKNNMIIKTEPYIYTSLEAYGITYAKKVRNNSSVIGLDVSLKSMSKFLKEQLFMNDSEIYLLKSNGLITSSAKLSNTPKELNFDKIKETKLPYLKQAKLNDLSNIDSVFKLFEKENKNFYFYTSKLHTIYNNKEFLSILLPIDTIMKPYNEKIFYSSFLTVIILLLVIPLVWLATKLLISPIHKLAKENFKITNRQFNEVRYIETNIKELNELSYSLVALSESIQKYEADQKKLMDSFIELIASAIDAKSKYTGGHCERVPVLSMLIAKEASNDKTVFKDFTINNEDEERELNVAAWLHDCGKVTTPEYVVDKATKLETIYNRIHEIRTRFEVIYRDLTIKSLENILAGANEKEEQAKLKIQQDELIKEYAIIANANIGGEFMDDESIKKVEEIAQRTWTRYFDNTIGISRDEKDRLERNKDLQTPNTEYLLSNKLEHIIERTYSLDEEYKKYGFKQKVPEHLYNLGEVYNLAIRRGTLTDEERYKINEHSIMTIIMLEQLPFLDNLKNVPEFAGSHHETLIGTGYPRQLTKEQMSLPARIIAVADVFEALTSSDRPYKEAKTLSASIKILSFMVKDQHLDKDVFELFLKSGIYKEYAKKYLTPDQIDEVDISKYI